MILKGAALPSSHMVSGEMQDIGFTELAQANKAMERYANGDKEAFSELFDIIEKPVKHFIRRYVKEHDIADDLFQQTFLRIHQARGSFVPGCPVLPWAITISRRLIWDYFRRNKLQFKIFDHDATLDIPSYETPEKNLLQKQLSNTLWAAIKKLPLPQQQALTLTKDLGLTLSEAAGNQKTTVTAIKLRLHRALQTLKKLSKDDL